MYAPAHFRIEDQAELVAFIEARRFGTLVVAGADGLHAAHIPMLVNVDADGRAVSLEGHVARNNPVAAIARPTQAMAIFHGADAYVTPSFYPSKRDHGQVVPTWNYVAVQATGLADVFTEPDALHRQAARMTDAMEASSDAPWSVSDAPETYIARMLNAITGVRLSIHALEGSRKLSQNKSAADRAGVRDGLGRSPNPSARQIAAEMPKEA